MGGQVTRDRAPAALQTAFHTALRRSWLSSQLHLIPPKLTALAAIYKLGKRRLKLAAQGQHKVDHLAARVGCWAAHGFQLALQKGGRKVERERQELTDHCELTHSVCTLETMHCSCDLLPPLPGDLCRCAEDPNAHALVPHAAGLPALSDHPSRAPPPRRTCRSMMDLLTKPEMLGSWRRTEPISFSDSSVDR